jgi:hypothetical protein
MVARIALIILACALLLLGVFTLRNAYNNLEYAKDSESWLKTTGVVAISQVVETRDSHNKTIYRAGVIYSYNVGDARYSCSRISYGQISGSQKEAEARVAKYPKGATVDVYYNPTNPGQAVLQAGIDRMTWIELALGATFFGLGIAVAIVVRRWLRTK